MTSSASPAKPRVLVLPQEETPNPRKGRAFFKGLAIMGTLVVGLVLGYRAAEILLPEPLGSETKMALSERVRGGLYALELAQPAGKARWMLEFDAEIKTLGGPKDPLHLRNALEKLVIDATSLPIVQTAERPEELTRWAMLEMAKQDFPWLLDIYLTRSDIRAPKTNRLEGLGEAMRSMK